MQRRHEDTQREINRQNALVQIYKATIEAAATKNMSNEEVKEIFNAVTKYLDESKQTQQNQTSSDKPSNSGNTNE